MRLNWFLLWFAYSSLFAFGFIDNARGPVFPDILKDFALSDSIGALFFLVASGAALINNLLLFKWLERIGSYRTTQVYSVAQVIGLLIIGLGPVFPITLIGAAFVGVSFGGLGISHNLLVTESVPADGGTGGQLGLRRRALSGLHATYGVSSLLAPLTITWLYKLGFNWRMSLAWLAVGPTLVLLLSLFGKPSGITLLTKAQQSQPRGKRALKVAMFFAVMSTGYVIAEISIGTRLALFARREWGFSLETANDLVSLFFVGLFLGRLLFAVFHFPLGNRAILTLSASLGLVCYMLGLVSSPTWLAVAGLALSVFYPCMFALINDEQAPLAGYVTSWCITLQALGLMAMHFLLGGLSDLFGLRAALCLGPCALLLVLICLSAKSRFAPVYVTESPI